MTLEDRVARYVAAKEDRDQLVKDLTAAGWGPVRISRALGMGRPTIGRILGARWAQDHGHGYKTAPRNVSHETKEGKCSDGAVMDGSGVGRRA